MIRLALVNSTHRDAALSAARAAGLQCRPVSYSAHQLEKLKEPVLLMFDSDAVEHLTPELLQSLRKTHTTGVRHSPAVVLCRRRGEVALWRDAGCVAVMLSSGPATLQRAVKEAVSGAADWVTSKSYVGPSRRRRKAIVRLRSRRRDDEAARTPKAGAGSQRPAASLSVLHRRLHLGASLITSSTLESRRAFAALALELRSALIAHHRPDLASIGEAISREAEAFAKDGQRDSGVLERLIEKLGEKL